MRGPIKHEFYDRDMKILLVSLHFVEYAVELAQALSRTNTVHLILSRDEVSRTVKDELHGMLEGKASYTLIDRYSMFNPRILKNLLVIRRVIASFGPDIIHHQESRDTSNLFVLLSPKAPVVVGTVHDVTVHPGTTFNYQWFIKKIRRFILQRIYRKVIVHGDVLKKRFMNEFQREDVDVFVVPHGVLGSFKSQSMQKVCKEEGSSILFFGRMLEYKGLQTLIDAEPIVSSRVPDFKVIIAGRGDDLRRKKELISANPHFEIHDRHIPNDEVSAFFERAAIITLPYIEASQSGIVAMAFVYGKPVIVTDVGSLTEIVKNNRNGLVVPPGDAEGLATAIVELLKNKRKRKSMGEEALKTSRTTLNWDHIADLTMEVYKAALNTT